MAPAPAVLADPPSREAPVHRPGPLWGSAFDGWTGTGRAGRKPRARRREERLAGSAEARLRSPKSPRAGRRQAPTRSTGLRCNSGDTRRTGAPRPPCGGQASGQEARPGPGRGASDREEGRSGGKTPRGNGETRAQQGTFSGRSSLCSSTRCRWAPRAPHIRAGNRRYHAPIGNRGSVRVLDHGGGRDGRPDVPGPRPRDRHVPR